MTESTRDALLTGALLRDIRRNDNCLSHEFADLVEGALLESYSGHYDGSYPPAGHTYPQT